MSETFDDTVETIRERVEPDQTERTALSEAVAALISRTESALADLSVDADVIQVGSTARDTWLAGDRDIDLFVCLSPSLDREELESIGLRVGHTVLPDGREEFAEHPYVVGEFDGFDVDLVPCYSVDSAAEIQSAVDRTPFHTQYVTEQLTPALASDVRVCKQLFTGIGVYGSDLKTRGFSGFLTELLVCEYGGFRSLVEAIADWQPPIRLDPEAHGTESFDDPLVVIDPTDPTRNVAAVLSSTNLARVQHFARELLADPRPSLFEQHAPEPLDAETVRDQFDRRGTTPLAIRFQAPEIVDDQLWPQLRRSRDGLRGELDRLGFDVFRSAIFADETAVLLFELAVAERPAVERHDGPPVHVREHAESFFDAYDDTDAYGPFIDGDRYVVERGREWTSAAAFLDSDAIFDVALGAHIETALSDSYELRSGEQIGALTSEFGIELAEYFAVSPRSSLD